jgi:ABC-type dipeptide/oligopeptide/nickel transport system permease subunit
MAVRIDNVIQRLIEFIRSVPEIPLVMGLAAALPADWPVVRLYFGVTVVLSFIGWTGWRASSAGAFSACAKRILSWRRAWPAPVNSASFSATCCLLS